MPPAVAVAVVPPVALCVHTTLLGVRVADTSTKPVSLGGRVKTSWKITPGTADGPSL